MLAGKRGGIFKIMSYAKRGRNFGSKLFMRPGNKITLI